MKIRNLLWAGWVCGCIAAALPACSSDDPKQDYNPLIDDPKPEQPSESQPTTGSRTEQYRPQIHFTPARNWMNDPNGMVYADGTYHLFYQYNPQGNDWGNMSWGHATSTDLLHWTEQPVALTRDELGDIFSGSCVIDMENTAGFGAGAMVAIYTSAAAAQQQSIAYSTDGGRTFTRYAGNPVIANDDDNLRDPKVFWHEDTHQWIMTLAKGWKRGVEIYASPDLKTWSHKSTFVVDLPGRPNLQWECPDLFTMDGKWVMLVSVNPGGPILGSGTMYFVGDFDGTTFTPDALDYPLWLDYGMDNYAGVTWSGAPDGRRILIGWMNNWEYAGAVPCSPWRSAMTLPRELKLIEVDGRPLLTADIVAEVQQQAGEWQTVTQGTSFHPEAAYQLRVSVPTTGSSQLTLSNEQGQSYAIDIYGQSGILVAHRTSQSGVTTFHGNFAMPSLRAPLNAAADGTVTLDLYVDQSSIELLTDGGRTSQTDLVFPATIYDRVTLTETVPASDIQVRHFETIWK